MDGMPELGGLVDGLLGAFGPRLRTVVLFGSRARGDARPASDYDILLVIEGLPEEPVRRLREVRTSIASIPAKINTVAKTPQEVAQNVTPLLLDICMDGECLYGSDYFAPYRDRAMAVLRDSGLKRRRAGRETWWQFPRVPRKEWELTWEGFRELN